MYEANSTSPYQLFIHKDETMSASHHYQWVVFKLSDDARWYHEVARAALDIVHFEDEDEGYFFRDFALAAWQQQIEKIKEKYGDKLEVHLSEKK